MTRFGRDGGSPYSLVGLTGTMAAALAQDAIVFAMRAAPNPASGPVRAPIQIDGVYLAWTTIVAFTTPVTAGRRLSFFKGTVASPTGGTALSPFEKYAGDVGPDNGLEASPRIATTAGLTAGSFVRGSVVWGTLDLSAFGAAGARVEKYYPFLDSGDTPLVLNPGELFVISNPVAMDAAGTWQLLAEVDYRRRD